MTILHDGGIQRTKPAWPDPKYPGHPRIRKYRLVFQDGFVCFHGKVVKLGGAPLLRSIGSHTHNMKEGKEGAIALQRIRQG